MLSFKNEKLLLQIIVALACMVPASAGLAGALKGIEFLGRGSIDLDSHFRYLSGLLLGMGIGFCISIPHIERYAARFRLLTLIVFIGGACRLLGWFFEGMPDPSMIMALCMELIVTPLICLWQQRVARRFAGANTENKIF